MVRPSYVLAIDQGTTGSTVLVYDHAGRVVSRAYSEFRQHYPQPGWVEHDPEEIWRVTLEVIRKALRSRRISSRKLAAVGITNQRETTVVWSRRTGKPISRAIVWQDRRTAPICADLKSRGLIETFRHKTGLVIDPYFSASKVRWLLDNVKGAQTRAEEGELCFGTIDSWLIWKLTSGRVHATDYTNASRTLFFNIHDKRWDDELLEIFRVPHAMLPRVVYSSGVLGETDPKLFGGHAVPIAGIAGDQQAALFGQACFHPGMVKNTYGTGCFLLMPTGGQAVSSTRGLLTTLACGSEGQPTYALEGSIFIAGAAVQWLRDGLAWIKTAAETEAVARKTSDTLGVYVVPAFVGLGAPYWDPNARGAIVGLTRGVKREHIIRATLESLAYQTRDVVDTMVAESDKQLKTLRADGGASQNDFLMQFQADLLDAAVDRPKVIETTATGAAFLAGLGVGFWKSTAELERIRKIDRIFQPHGKRVERNTRYEGWKRAVGMVRTQ
ncbi:MAG TPA: glycerol kinase GlpK [Candidatus Binatia bacterium]|nr:glycerol kinase GlpK [Candidatus Binatia bacterium]